MNDDDNTWVCDRCSETGPMDDSYPGPEGTEWEGCGLCEECHAEVQAETDNT